MSLNTLTAWSYSRFSDWNLCAAKAKYKHVIKLPDPGNNWASEGVDVHEVLKRYVLGKGEYPEEAMYFKAKLDALLKGKKIYPETQWALDKNWKTADWYSKQAWVRAVNDLMLVKGTVADLVEYKLGKYKETHKEQTELTALVILCANPAINKVITRLWYLGHEYEAPPITIDRKSADALKKKWNRRVAGMMADTVFAPTPGPYCKWCAYGKKKKGPCPY